MSEYDTQFAKNFLKGYQNALKKLEAIRLQIDELRASQLGGCINYTDMPKAHNIKDLSDYAAKYDELLRKFCDEKNEALCQMEQIHQVISTLSSQEEKKLLVLRYIKRINWDDLPHEMSMSKTSIHRIHSRALQNISKIIKNGTEWN